ncbi:unnamed protein product [Linum trigynum]|uniref:Uncharacterized protein n=1 Tax=Linum trigynum TaxID=586398 RepID=A0AAV2DZN0_9ROSI
MNANAGWPKSRVEASDASEWGESRSLFRPSLFRAKEPWLSPSRSPNCRSLIAQIMNRVGEEVHNSNPSWRRALRGLTKLAMKLDAC